MSDVIVYRGHVVSRTEECRLYYQYSKTKNLQFPCFASLHTPTYTTLPKATARRKDVMTLVFRNQGDDIPIYYEIPICISSLRPRGACIHYRGPNSLPHIASYKIFYRHIMNVNHVLFKSQRLSLPSPPTLYIVNLSRSHKHGSTSWLQSKYTSFPCTQPLHHALLVLAMKLLIADFE